MVDNFHRQPEAATLPRGEPLEQALEQAQANLVRYQEMFDFAPDGYLVTDPQGVIQEANYTAAAMLGTRKELLADKPLLFYVAHGDRRAFATKLQHLGSKSGSLLQWELTLHPPGAAGPVYVSVTAAHAPTVGQPATLRWTFRDITRRRQAEEDLRAQIEFADSLVELAEAAILVLDDSGRITRVNRYLCVLTGHEPDELHGRRLADLVLPEDQVALRQDLGPLMTGSRHAHGVHRLRTKNGRTRTVAWSARILTAGPGRQPWTLLVGHDITELQEAQRRAVQAERLAAVGQMATGLAHEGRNALQRSQGCLSMLALRLQNQPEALNLLDRAQKAQDDLQRLYEEVRGYAAPIRLEVATCDLARLWREAWDDVRAARAGRDAELGEDVQAADVRCQASWFHLKQVFRNLLENALGAAEGPVRITIRCAEATVEGRPGLRVTVEDNGPGFTPEQRQKAFEPFFTTKVRGTGLGLAICKRLVEAHGGRITLGEPAGPGAAVVITLPRRMT